LRLLDSYAEALTLQLAPWKETSPRNVTPMAVVGAVGVKFRRARRRLGRGRAGRGSMGPWGSVWVVVWPLEAAGTWRTGGQRWRSPRAVPWCGRGSVGGRMGTSSCPRGSGLGLRAWLGGGWLKGRGSPERVHGE
jgi:hypothetical protein